MREAREKRVVCLWVQSSTTMENGGKSEKILGQNEASQQRKLGRIDRQALVGACACVVMMEEKPSLDTGTVS